MQPREVLERIQQSKKTVQKGWHFNPEKGEITGVIGRKEDKFLITEHTIFDSEVWDAWWTKDEIDIVLHDRVGLIRIDPALNKLRWKIYE